MTLRLFPGSAAEDAALPSEMGSFHWKCVEYKGQNGFDLLGIRMIVCEGGVNLGETEMPVLGGDLFRSQAHFVPSRDTHHGHSGSGNLGPSTSYCGIAIDQTSDLS